MVRINNLFLSIMITMSILLTGSAALCENKTDLNKGSLSVSQGRRWGSIEEIIAESALRQGKATTAVADKGDGDPKWKATTAVADRGDGDPKLLQELLEQGEKEMRNPITRSITWSSPHAEMIASR